MNLKHLLLSFEGRIGRRSYWTGAVVLFGIGIVAAVIGAGLGEGGQVLVNLVSLVLLYPSLALAAKRWHDRNKSGWWSLIALVPLVGPIWMLVENGFLRGTPGPNRFGPDPAGPLALEHEGRTYYRHADGHYTDMSGSPVRDAALIAMLGATYHAVQAAWSGPDGGTAGAGGGGDRGGAGDSGSSGDGGPGGDGGGSGGD